MEGAHRSGVDPPPPPRSPHGHPQRAHSPSLADLLLPATFLAITVAGILFVLLILVIWLHSLGKAKKYDKPSKIPMDQRQITQHFKVIVENADDFQFKLPSDLKYIDEERDGSSHVSPKLMNMKKSGGSSPKIPGKDEEPGDSGDSTPGSAKSKGGNSKFVFPPSDEGAGTSKPKSDGKKMKVALPEQQWILHRKPPLDWRGYNINIPNKTFGLSDVVRADLAVDSASSADTSRKYSATRSPSLEKDEKSPFPIGMKNDVPIVFGFGSDVSKKVLESSGVNSGDSSPVVQVRVQPLATDSHCVAFDAEQSRSKSAKVPESKTVISRRFGPSNTGLHINTTLENVSQSFGVEKSEVQHSPRLSDSAVGKENNPSPRFSFSPKFFATPDSKSPNFFGTPDQKSPKFFATLDSKSPAFFAENQSRNASPRSFSSDRMSPRLMSTSSFKSVQSPLIIGNADGECFRFDRSELDSNKTATQEDIDSVFLNKKESYDEESLEPYNPKTDLEKPVEDSDNTSNEDRILNNVVESTESVHSCPRIISSISIPSSDEGFLHEVNDNKTEHCNEITVDASHLIATTAVEQALQNTNNEHTAQKKPTLNTREESTDSLVIPNSGNTANYRRQRLKSISLDSDNAKFIEQNLGIPIVKHLKHENLYDPCNNSKEEECVDYNIEVTSPQIISKASYFKFDDDENDLYKVYDNGNDPRIAVVHQTVTTVVQSDDPRASPDIVSPIKFLRDNSSAIAFSEMQPRFSPKEFDAFITDDEKISKNKNIRNLTIDINKRDSELEKELMEYDCLDSGEKRLTPKTPTLKIKATSLDSSENLNLSLPVTNTLQVPQNSISVPNTPKRQMKRTLSQKTGKLIKSSHCNVHNYLGNLNDLGPRSCQENQQRKLFMSVKCPSTYVDSGIFLRENHANLMLFQASKYPLSRSFNSNSSNFSRRMGSFDENMVDLSEAGGNLTNQREFLENRLSLHKPCDSNLLGSNLLGFKQNLSVSSTNLKTLPEGVPSNDFDTHPANEKCSKKTLLQRRGSNQSLTINLDAAGSSLKYSTLSLQGSNLSLASFGASSHNLNNIKNSASNFSLNTDNRQKKNILERRNSNTSLTLNLECTPQHGRLYTGSNCNLQGSHYSLTNNENITVVPGKKCLLQRRGSNTSLTLNLQGSVNSNLDRCTSNSSLNIQNEAKVGKKKGLLERRSSNTSLTLNINNSNPQFDSNRVLSVSNYNLDGSGCTLSRYNSNQSINNAEKKGLLERRSSNTSLTLNLNSCNYNLQGCAGDVMRDIEIDETVIQNNLVTNANQQKEKHRKSLSTENLFPKSYKSRVLHCKNSENVYSFGSHDNLWSNSYASDSFNEHAEIAGGQNLTYVCGDQENEMIYAFGDRQHMEQAGLQGSIPIKNITTKPLSPHSTSEDFKMYLANIQHLQNASNTLTRQQLKDLNTVFQDGYSKGVCSLMNKKSPTDILTSQLTHLMLDRLNPDNESSNEGEYNPQRLLPEPVLPRLEYQKTLLRNLHQEFWDLPTNFQEKPMVFGSHPKNRYKTILPNEHSRVILRPEVGETDEGYINANYIKGHEYSKNCYIATQGPLQNTTYDFWLMVYQNSCQFYKDGCTKTNEDRHFGSPQGRGKKTQDSPEKSPDSQAGIQKIVMLTNLIENGRQKCEKYFPLELNEEMTFKQLPNSSYSSACSGGSFFPDNSSVDDKLDESEANSFKIKNVGITNKTGYTIRKLLVEYSNKFAKTMKDCDSEKGRVIPNIHSERSRISESVEIIVDEPQMEISGERKDNSGDKVNSLVVYHYWFDNWADHKCPKDVTALLDLSMDVVQNRLLNLEEFDTQPESTVGSNNRPSRSKSFDKPEIPNPHKSNMDKSMTYFDFSTYSSNSDSKDAIDMHDIPRERRPSAFQLAKAFFDEVAKANTEEQTINRPGRKNSLASRLDLPKNRHDLATRRESTGRIDSKLHQSKKSAHNVSNDSLKPSFAHKEDKSVAEKPNDEELKEMPPIIVHCSAGIGRTGCLIAILNGIRQMKADQRVDILGIVCNMRLNRGGMVQNSEQYELIHKVLCLYEELGLPDVG